MPGLVFGSRRLLLGGDEFMLPYATCACGRMVWVLFLSVGLVLSINILLNTNCMGTGYMALVYVSTSIVVGALSFVVELQIANASTFGTIIDPGPRKKLLEKHLTRKSILGAVQLVLGVFGVVLLLCIPVIIHCEKTMAMIITGIILTTVSQFLDAGSMFCCFLAFTSPASDGNSWIQDDLEGDEELMSHGVLAEMERRYEEFCRGLCKWVAWCSCTFRTFGEGNGQEVDFAHVSRVFSRMLSARRFMDVVPTDIAAGLVLVRHMQKSEDYKRRDELMGGDGTPTYCTVSKDPSLEDLYKGTRNTSSRNTVVANIRDVGESTGADDGSWGGFRFHGGVLSPGSLPLQERPQKHRKYYKVSRNEQLLDLEHGGQDWQVLEETAHFVRYANVMYSVWNTIAVDPGRGVRRMVTRSGSWCPRFVMNFTRRFNKFKTPRRSKSSSERDGLSGTHMVNQQVPFSSVVSSDVDVETAMETGNLRETEIRGDNWWGSHETALRAELPEGTELVLAHFRNCLEETPYCVVLDHKWQSVVIAVRGTHSFEDFLVDAMAEPRSLEYAGREWGFDGSGMYAHEGILRRAEWIRRDLEDSGILRLLLGDGFVRDVGNTDVGVAGTAEAVSVEGTRNHLGGSYRTSSRVPLASAVEGSGFCAGYSLRIVGHSLGGGCAALLTLLLKPVYPSVKALAVSPPGGLISEGACREATEAMVISLVLNDDVVPRMSSQSIEALADQVLEVLGRSRVSKLVVMRSLLRGDEDAHRPDQYLDLGDLSLTGSSLGGEEKDRQPPRPPVLGTNERQHSETANTGSEDVSRYHRQLRRYREHLRRERGSRRHLYHLRPPGRILHLVNTDFVMEQMDVHTCDDGCLTVCCCCLASPAKPNDVKACCCTPGRAHRKRRVFTPVWSSANDLAEIKVTGAFLFDHSPDEILKAMEQMLEDLGVSV